MGPRREALTSLDKRYHFQVPEAAKNGLKAVALTSAKPESSSFPVMSPTLDCGVGGEVTAVTLKGLPCRDILPHYSLLMREARTTSL